MNTVIMEMILSQLIFWGVVVFAFLIYLQFKRSKDGKLRLLIMELFLAKMWCYGVAGLYYLLWDANYLHDWNLIVLRIVCNIPMLIAMARLYFFITQKNKIAKSEI